MRLFCFVDGIGFLRFVSIAFDGHLEFDSLPVRTTGTARVQKGRPQIGPILIPPYQFHFLCLTKTFTINDCVYPFQQTGFSARVGTDDYGQTGVKGIVHHFEEAKVLKY